MNFEIQNPKHLFSDEELLADVRRVASELGDAPLTTRAYQEIVCCKASTLTSRFGPWIEVLRAAGISITRGSRTTADGYLEDLRKVASELGTDSLTIGDYRANGSRFSERPFIRHFGTWRKALQEAGLQLRPPRVNTISNVDLFKNMEEVWILLGRQPKMQEMRKPLSRYSWGPYKARFGPWKQVLQAFVEYVSQEETQPEHRDANVELDAEPGPAAADMVANTSETDSMQRYVAAKSMSETLPVPATGTASRSFRKTTDCRRTPRHPSARLTVKVLIRDASTCRYCGRTSKQVAVHVDHIVPWSKGGETVLENLQVLCETCNLGKSSSTEEDLAG